MNFKLIKENKSGLIILLIFGFIIGTIQSLYSYFIFIALGLASFYFYIYRRYSAQERGFLIKVSLISMLLLVSLSIAGKMYGPYLNEYGLPSSFSDRFEFGDGEVMYRKAYNINMLARDQPDKIIQVTPDKVEFSGYGFSAQLYWMSMLFYVFQFDTILPALTNILFFNIAALLVYSLSSRLFSRPVARINYIIFLFFPSMMAWSISIMKDTSIIFMATFFTWLAYSLIKGKPHFGGMFKILIMVVLFFLLEFSRNGIGIVMIASVFLPLLFLRIWRSRARRIFLRILICSAVIAGAFSSGKIIKNISSFYEQSFRVHLGTVLGKKGFHYHLYDDKFYSYPIKQYPRMIDYARASLRGMAYFLLAPFPTDIKSVSFLVSAIPMSIWYVLFLCFIYGISVAVRNKDWDAVVLVIPVFAIALFYGIHSGNFGTIFRHRDMLTPFCLYFAALGINHILLIYKDRRSNEPVK